MNSNLKIIPIALNVFKLTPILQIRPNILIRRLGYILSCSIDILLIKINSLLHLTKALNRINHEPIGLINRASKEKHSRVVGDLEPIGAVETRPRVRVAVDLIWATAVASKQLELLLVRALSEDECSRVARLLRALIPSRLGVAACDYSVVCANDHE